MCSLECVFAIDASFYSRLYKLLLSTNYVLKMTPERTTDGSINILSFKVKRRLLERKEISDYCLQ